MIHLKRAHFNYFKCAILNRLLPHQRSPTIASALHLKGFVCRTALLRGVFAMQQKWILEQDLCSSSSHVFISFTFSQISLFTFVYLKGWLACFEQCKIHVVPEHCKYEELHLHSYLFSKKQKHASMSHVYRHFYSIIWSALPNWDARTLYCCSRGARIHHGRRWKNAISSVIIHDVVFESQKIFQQS